MRWIASVALIVACGGAPDKAESTGSSHDQHAAEGGHHQHGGPIGHRFEKAEDWVPRFEGPERDAWQKPEDVVGLLGIEPGMVVADIGAGTGYFLPHLSRAAGPDGKVLGLDIEADMVRYMNERAKKESLSNVEARVVEFDDPKLAAGSVDRVLIVNTWHHIPGREAYAAKLKSALRDGGAVFIVDFTMESKHGPPRDHRLLPDDVVAELQAAGLTATVEDESLPEQYVVSAR